MSAVNFKYSEFCEEVYKRGQIIKTQSVLDNTPYDCARYMSHFLYDTNIFTHLRETNSIGGYPGKIFCRDVVIDIDRSTVKDALSDVRVLIYSILERVPEEYIAVYFSGNKGFHVLINSGVWGLAPGKLLHKVIRETAKDISPITIDEAIYSKSSLIRIPNSRHQKTGLFKTRLPLIMLRGSVWDIFDFAMKPGDQYFPTKLCEKPILKPKNPPIMWRRYSVPSFSGVENIRPCAEHIKQYGAARGDRNKSAIVLACELLNKCGWSFNMTKSFIQKWNDSLVTPPLTEEELGRILQSAGRGYIFGCSNEMLQKHCTGVCKKL